MSVSPWFQYTPRKPNVARADAEQPPDRGFTTTVQDPVPTVPNGDLLVAALMTDRFTGETLVLRAMTRSRAFLGPYQLSLIDPGITQLYPDLPTAQAAAQALLFNLRRIDPKSDIPPPVYVPPDPGP